MWCFAESRKVGVLIGLENRDGDLVSCRRGSIPLGSAKHHTQEVGWQRGRLHQFAKLACVRKRAPRVRIPNLL